MLKNYIIPVIVCLVVTLVMWFALQKIHPVFSTAAIEADARQKGGMSAEMIEEYRGLVLKSNCITFGIWGAVLAGLSGLLANPGANSRVRGALLGLVLGAIGGVLGAYLGQMQEARTDYQGASGTYWIMRWAALTAPMAVASVLACAASGKPKQLGDCFAGGLIGLLIGVIAISLLHGIATPLEKPENVFPDWIANRVLSMFAINVAVFSAILSMSNRSTKSATSTTSESALAG